VCAEEGLNYEFTPAYHRVKTIVYHYGFDPNLHFHDIAVVVLEEPISFAPHIQPIKMNKIDDRSKI